MHMSYRYSKNKIQWFVDNIWYKEVKLESAKSSWPWWQNVNKNESKIQLSREFKKSNNLPDIYIEKFEILYKNLITEDWVFRIDAQVHRSQLDNKKLVQKKLSNMIFEAFKPPKAPRKITQEPKHAADTRIAAKKRKSKLRKSRTHLKIS